MMREPLKLGVLQCQQGCHDTVLDGYERSEGVMVMREPLKLGVLQCQQGCHDTVLDGYERSEGVMGDEGATETWRPPMPTRLP